MQVSTKAIVLTSIKYGDSSLIVRCYTEKSGSKSYLLRGVLKSKKGKLRAAYFQPLTQIELVANHAIKSDLHTIKEARIAYAYETIFKDYTKQSIAFFIAEMLGNAIREEEGNPTLYAYIETALKWLDLHSSVSNFHLVFLLHLTKYLGFYPKEFQNEDVYFNMEEGRFSDVSFGANSLANEDLFLFKNVLGIKFDTMETLSLNVRERQRLLEIILKYFEMHLMGFKRPKSMEVLKKLFS